jgi:NAD(P)-dependent dehydrogenase (short-subunit alcohol dehydrogenase family)
VVRRVIVTGGASGLGAAVTHALVERGDRVGVIDRQPAEGSDHVVADLADGSAARAATAELIERMGGVDAVVTCAGTDSCGPFDDVSWKDWERVVAVNLLGTAAVVHAALPELRHSDGHVVTVASSLGLRALPDATAYCASKFGVIGFTRALAAELKGAVATTMLVPAGMSTAFFDGRPAEYRPPEDAQLCDPDDVARVVLFALDQPRTGSRSMLVRELVVTSPTEPSWP